MYLGLLVRCVGWYKVFQCQMLSLNVASSIDLCLVTFITRLYIIDRYEGLCIKRSQHTSYKKCQKLPSKFSIVFMQILLLINNDPDVHFEVVACWDLLPS